jgi:hypothetical protein
MTIPQNSTEKECKWVCLESEHPKNLMVSNLIFPGGRVPQFGATQISAAAKRLLGSR